MPKKLDLSDRYARGGQKRPRRRTPSLTVSQPVEVGPAEPAASIELTKPAAVARPAAPPPPAPVARPVQRPRPAIQTDYSYIRKDLLRIAVIVGILLILMAVLYLIIR